jgi:2-polyprenyl-6-methoxyphenol hydroxylase-like FAD-dependent oxidoreductase
MRRRRVDAEDVYMFGKKKPEVLVVGAGPVGLFTALALVKRGIAVQIVDKEWRKATHSYALALHAHSLKLLESVGLLGPVLDHAYRVRTIGLYDGTERQAELHLSELDEDFSFLAVMQQDVLEQLLEKALHDAGVKVDWNHQVAYLEPNADHVTATIDRLQKESLGYTVAHTEWVVAKSRKVEVPYVIGADGCQSDVRRALGLGFEDVGNTEHFAVYEFKTDADLQHEMRLVMNQDTTNVLWPLPDGYCRWSFQLKDFVVPATTRMKDSFLVELGPSRFPVLNEDQLHTFIAERAPWFNGSVDHINWRIVVRFERRLASGFGWDRMWLVGDAAHMTGPVGIQSMNVGMREADDLADRLARILREGESSKVLDAYNAERLAEWRFLLGLEGGLKPQPRTAPWVRLRHEHMLPCLPASGDDLERLAAQLHLDAKMRPARVSL